ncbi:MAG: apolipoprotein N-acyltransferase [Pirellulaceae bacterium]
MNGIDQRTNHAKSPSIAVLAAAGVALQWLSQPPLAWWPIALVALVPWLMIVGRAECIMRRGGLAIYLAGLVYWLLSLQGLRHAHPAIYAGWFALGAYLSIYGVLFVALSRRLIRMRVPLWVTAPVIWVGLECVRNYFATGISAAMLGHTLADVPLMIQIADMFGTYGVSFVVVAINVAVYELIANRWPWSVLTQPKQVPWPAMAFAIALTLGTLVYGQFRLNEMPDGDELATFALIQRSEVVEYVQDPSREADMFYNYARQSMSAVIGTEKTVHAIVWPESMLSGGMFWVDDQENALPPAEINASTESFRSSIDYQQNQFSLRATDLQNAFATSNTGRSKPHLIGGCGVVRYTKDPQMFSGMINIDSSGKVANWYGKTHRVMLGEYIPVLSALPFMRPFIPLGLRLSIGPGPQRFQVGDTIVSPNICIETAVERVAVNHLAQLRDGGGLPDVIVTVTNDGWFDDSSVIDHHLRCAQLVAVGCRRPLLSAANNGPTAWIDSHGQIVQQLETGSDGSILATPQRDDRISAYLIIGDWPARILALVCIGLMGAAGRDWWRKRKTRQAIETTKS